MDARTSRLAAVAGVSSPIVLLATLVAGATLSDGYDWPREAFSVIGGTGGTAALVFNVGVVAGGLLALPFAWLLWTVWRPVLGALYGIVGLSFVVAGAFPIGSPFHDVAAAIFVVGPLVPVVAGIVDWRAGNPHLALGQVLLGVVAVSVWIPYDLGVESAQVGYGGAELAAILVLAAWSVGTVARLWSSGGADSIDSSASTA